MGRSLFLPEKLSEKILLEELGWLILRHHRLGLRVVFKRRLKHVQRTVVSSIQRVLDVLSQCHFELATTVGLTNLEQAVTKAFHKSLSSIIEFG